MRRRTHDLDHLAAAARSGRRQRRLSGLGELAALDGTRACMEATGVAGTLPWPTVAFEVGAGLLVIIGYRTRIVAALLAGFCVVCAALFRLNFADQIQMIMFPKNLSMSGGFLLRAGVGAGHLSLDGRAGRP